METRARARMSDDSTERGPWTSETLPRPFLDAPREDASRSAIGRAYDWHQYLARLHADAAILRRDAERIERGAEPLAVDAALARSMLDLVRDFNVDPVDIAAQILACAEMQHAVRFADAAALDEFVARWTAAHGRVIGAIGGLGRYTWQRELIGEAARGFFLTGHLMTLEEALERGHLYFPLSDAESVGLDVADVFSGRKTPGLRRFLWKQVVRARDSFAQSQRLVDDLDRRSAASFRRWWFAALEILNQIERNNFDIWAHPPRLSAYHRAHVRFQARFGRTTFR
jgi:15-cis-phytoene synthase